jgi:hypothetical protein
MDTALIAAIRHQRAWGAGWAYVRMAMPQAALARRRSDLGQHGAL